MVAEEDERISLLSATVPNGTRITPKGANVKVKRNFKYKTQVFMCLRGGAEFDVFDVSVPTVKTTHGR